MYINMTNAAEDVDISWDTNEVRELRQRRYRIKHKKNSELGWRMKDYGKDAIENTAVVEGNTYKKG